jgi:predicted RNA-binding Zn-ribbon protein involved in translation (DUF1610 family)
MMLDSYTSGLFGNLGTQVRFRCPSCMEEAIRIALIVEQAEQQDRRGDTFYLDGQDRKSNGTSPSYREHRGTNPARVNTSRPHAQSTVNRRYRVFTDKAEMVCYECGGKGHMARDCATRRSKQLYRKLPDRATGNSPGLLANFGYSALRILLRPGRCYL